MFEVVLDRHLGQAEGTVAVSAVDVVAARFSMEVNATLASLVSGGEWPTWSFVRRCLALGPDGWRRYWHHSRILERVVSRLRVGLAH
jgi:hypothetical protein